MYHYSRLVVRIALSLASCCCAVTTFAQDNAVWNNTGVGDWATAANWDDPFGGNALPNGAFDQQAVISNGGVAFVASTISPLPGNLNLSGGSGVEIRSGGVLEVNASGSPLVSGATSVTGNSVLSLEGGSFTTTSLSVNGSGTLRYAIGGPISTPPVVVQGVAPGDLSTTGDLNLDFTSAPSGGDTFSLIGLPTSAVAGQTFGDVNVTGLAAQAVTTSFANLGGGNSELRASITNLLTLRVDRDSGNVFVQNTHGAPIAIDGYTIESAAGSLNPSGLTPGLGAGWTVSPAGDSNGVSELRENGSSAISNASSPQIGTGLFSASSNPPQFKQNLDDLTFQYRTSSGDVVSGAVVYEGTPSFNDIVLTIDSTGAANLKNFSVFTQEIEAYRITSSDGSLTPGGWTTFETQDIDGDGAWAAVGEAESDMLLAEFRGFGTTTVDRFNTYALGDIFNGTGDPSGLTFEYLLAGDDAFTEGIVFFGDLPDPDTGISGDYNGDGVVDSIDYAVWRENLGEPFGALMNDPTGVAVGTEQFNVWRANYGTGGPGASSLSALPTPEPSACLLILVGIVGAVAPRKRESACSDR